MYENYQSSTISIGGVCVGVCVCVVVLFIRCCVLTPSNDRSCRGQGEHLENKLAFFTLVALPWFLSIFRAPMVSQYRDPIALPWFLSIFVERILVKVPCPLASGPQRTTIYQIRGLRAGFCCALYTKAHTEKGKNPEKQKSFVHHGA